MSSDFTEHPGPRPNYNVAPTSIVPAMRAAESGGLSPAMMKWWLIPGWSKSPDARYATFNARSEDAATKPAFRGPFRHRRCVLPVRGFYEWQKLDAKTKQPHFIARADDAPLLLAGLWDCLNDELETCTILTRTPNAEMKVLHHRMPCILEPEQIEAWCDPGLHDVDEISSYLGPVADGILMTHAVSTRVNNARSDNDSQLTEAIG